MKNSDFLFFLVKAAMKEETVKGHEMLHRQFSLMLKLAAEQTVRGLFLKTILTPQNNVTLSRPDFISAVSIYNNVTEGNRHVRKILAELCSLLQDNDVCFFVVKGPTIAAIYSDPDTRDVGDIDFLVREKDFEKAVRIIKDEWDITFDDAERDALHLAFTYNDVHFEMHHSLMRFASARNQKAFDTIIAGCDTSYRKIGQHDVPVLPPAEEVVYTFIHLYHHFIELGIGMRHLCDLTVLLEHLPADAAVHENIEKFIGSLGMTKAFKAFEALCVRKLGLKAEGLPVAINDDDSKWTESIVKVMFKRGNFGMYARNTVIRSGIKYYVEELFLKLSQAIRFYRLSPREAKAIILKEIPSKIIPRVKQILQRR